MSAVWELPGRRIQSAVLRRIVDGFQLSGILAIADGRPFSPGVNGNPNPRGIQTGLLGTGGGFNRVPYVGRNVETLPGNKNVDLRLAREVRIGERMRWQFIIEGFNVLNRYQITGIFMNQFNITGSTLFPRPDFRSVNETGTNLFRERQLQLGTRFTF
jgi:hypothetical protein